MSEYLKVPPHSIEAEQSVLGGFLITGGKTQQCREVMDLLTQEMFYNHTHGLIYKALIEMKEMDIDLVTVSEYLDSKNLDEETGGFAYLAELSKNCPSAANIITYAELIREKSALRHFISIANTTAEMAFQGEKESQIDDYLNRELTQIERGGNYEPKHLSSMANSYTDTLEARNKGDKKALGIKTGIDTLDEQIGGILNNWLVVIAGRPSMGKTIISQLINSHIAKTENVLFFSMEMSEQEIMDRYVSLMSGVHQDHLKQGELSDYEWERISRAIGQIHNGQSKIYYDETPNLSVNQIKYRAKRTKKKVGEIGAIMIDYLGLMQLPKADRHDIAVGDVTRQLKELSKEINTPIFLLVQANRDTDSKRRPTMANLKDSSSIEADADLILFIHREEVNNEQTPFKGVTEIIPVKYRHGDCNKTSYIKRQGDDDIGYSFKCLKPAEVEELMNMAEQQKPMSRTYVK